ncbi:MAG: pilin [Candidatus Falkowbacteria bacterium]|nr:pilin [Candidatus Falkowbacteria bacterium]
MKFKFLKIKYLVTLVFSLLFILNIAQAATSPSAGPGLLQANVIGDINNNTSALQERAGYSAGMTIGGVVSAVIKAFLSILGVIFVILMILAGFNWMTANGDEEKINKAKDTLRAAVIGLIIIAASYAITYFVFQSLPDGTSQHGGS